MVIDRRATNGRESFSCTDSFVVNLSQRRSKSRILSLSLSRKRRSWLQRPAATHALRPLVAVYRQLHDADSLSWCVRAKTVDKIAYDLSSAFRTRTLGTLPPLGFRCRSCFRFFFRALDFRKPTTDRTDKWCYFSTLLQYSPVTSGA